MRKGVSVLLLALTLGACATSGGDDFEYGVAGPVPPPAKPGYEPQVFIPIENLDSDFLTASGTNSVFFDTNQSTLTPQARDILTRQLAWLITHRDVQFRIEGHCDERATEAYNRALGKRRAEAVKDFFVQHGIRGSRITTTSFGEESPVYDQYGDIQINRRAVTVLLPAGA
jgi:peptidoglycan-associated lipoprotein